MESQEKRVEDAIQRYNKLKGDLEAKKIQRAKLEAMIEDAEKRKAESEKKLLDETGLKDIFEVAKLRDELLVSIMEDLREVESIEEELQSEVEEG
ncbi:MAG: hypothetical protein BWX57_00369 [Tenericutes bacterium ADurb.Bin024]|jgi:phage regulator Rha-like protein|nr:MAG: hypothetical protein BWX57_00369 [Tenericutes bacterium ADurb.Bin024]HQQ39374.1 hypothetical protein [Bacilli bacterium]